MPSSLSNNMGSSGPPSFIFDENVSPRLVEIMEIVDRNYSMRHLCDFFKQGTPDQDWIKSISDWDPTPMVICGDPRIMKDRAESAALRDSKLSFLFLAKGWTNLNWIDWVWKFVKAWPEIEKNMTKILEPTIFSLHVSSLKVEKVCPTRGLGRGK